MNSIIILLAVRRKFFSVKNTLNIFTTDNDAYGTIVFIFAIGFVVIANVLLLNVLIAMFK